MGTWGQELRSGVAGRIFPQRQFGDQEVRPGEHLDRTSGKKCPKAEAKINIPSYMTPEGEEGATGDQRERRAAPELGRPQEWPRAVTGQDVATERNVGEGFPDPKGPETWSCVSRL